MSGRLDAPPLYVTGHARKVPFPHKIVTLRACLQASHFVIRPWSFVRHWPRL